MTFSLEKLGITESLKEVGLAKFPLVKGVRGIFNSVHKVLA
jgi:hypothetical protein